MMKKGWIILLSAFIAMALAFSMAMAQKQKKPAQKPKAVAVKSVEEAICFGCHTEIQKLAGNGKHVKGVNCALCHSETSAHLDDSARKPLTRLDLESCGSCHKEQFQTLMEVNLKSKAKQEK